MLKWLVHNCHAHKLGHPCTPLLLWRNHIPFHHCFSCTQRGERSDWMLSVWQTHNHNLCKGSIWVSLHWTLISGYPHLQQQHGLFHPQDPSNETFLTSRIDSTHQQINNNTLEEGNGCDPETQYSIVRDSYEEDIKAKPRVGLPNKQSYLPQELLTENVILLHVIEIW